jgi:hypothetical protein
VRTKATIEIEKNWEVLSGLPNFFTEKPYRRVPARLFEDNDQQWFYRRFAVDDEGLSAGPA